MTLKVDTPRRRWWFKRIIVCVLLIGASSEYVPTSAANETGQSMTIKTIGKHTLCVKPDRTKVILSIFTQDKSLVECSNRNDRAIAELYKVFGKLKVPSDCVQQTDLLFDRSYSYGFFVFFSSGSSSGSEGGKLSGYKVNRRVAVTLDSDTTARELIEDATRIGEVSLQAVSFEASDLEKLKLTARLNALDNCKSQAATLAGQLGMTIGKPISIENANVLVRYVSDVIGDDPYRRFETTHHDSFDNTPKYEVGKIAISADVTGTFEMRDKPD